MSDLTDVQSLRERVSAMRELGVTKWGDIELGPDPHVASPEADATQRSLALDIQAKQVADKIRRLRFGASGGPRPAGVPKR